ncbi:MAG: autotransporter-associated beta strand repeat-containing protein [Kiritimatiellia bacterium]
MSSGGLIDVQGGTMKNDYANANWSANQGGLNVSANAYFDLRNNNVTVGALTGAGSVYDNGFTNTLTVGAGNASGSYSGSIGLGGTTVVLTKTGTGTQTLTGNNVYSGATTVGGGTLEVAAGGVISNTSSSRWAVRPAPRCWSMAGRSRRVWRAGMA